MAAYPFTMLGTLLAALLTFAFAARTGMARGKAGVKAPEVATTDEFARANRVHLNTLEQLVVFLPVLWIFASLVNDMAGGIAAAIWLVGRVIYSQAYMADPSKRGLGFMIGGLTFLAMLLVSTGLIIWHLIAG